MKTNKISVLGLLCMVALSHAASPDDQENIIRRIVVVGNDKTQESVILREMTSHVGELLDEKKLEVDKNRIMNLDLFNRVEFQQLQMQDGLVLIVIVTERWYIFPYPILYLNEKDWDQLSYGAGLVHQNYRGANVELNSAVWFGFNPGLYASYSNPWFGGTHRFYARAQIFSYNMKNQSIYYERFNQKFQGGLFTFGKKWGYTTYLSLTAAYRRLSVPEKYKNVTLSGSGRDHLPSVGIKFRYDTRDFYFYPESGVRLDLYFTHTGLGQSRMYEKFGADFRFYLPVYKKLIIAGRGAADFSDGALPVYAKSYLGYDERIRGHFNTKTEGDQRAIFGAELRFPILPVRYHSFGENSPMGAYTKNLSFGISVELFYDAGATWVGDQAVRRQDFLAGYGIGLLFHVPYVYILRLEYALNRQNQSEVIFDIGVFF